ncbi:MAG: hypothetical protein M0027_03750 [Candidatus Dormibacteraeota bacterium]|jgi:hypothetical protein|nr:hypothetical protein [Candidatus Dormibacteraeota bacterium]
MNSTAGPPSTSAILVGLDISPTVDEVDKIKLALGALYSTGLVKQIARAGARELIAQAAGEAVFSSMKDLRSFRIACLVAEDVPMADIERVVAGLFKVPLRSARTMVSGAIARYKVQLDAHVFEVLKKLLDTATCDPSEGWFRVRVPSDLVHERLDNLLETLSVPGPRPSSIGTIYLFPDQTYQKLRVAHGLPVLKWSRPR